MICPKCKQYADMRISRAVDVGDDEIYRRRRCSKCRHVFFTCEFPVETTDDVLRIFAPDTKKQATDFKSVLIPQLIEEFEAGFPVRVIKKRHHISKETLHKLLEEGGHPYYDRRAARNSKILQDLSDGMTPREAAEKYGIDITYIYLIRRRGY